MGSAHENVVTVKSKNKRTRWPHCSLDSTSHTIFDSALLYQYLVSEQKLPINIHAYTGECIWNPHFWRVIKLNWYWPSARFCWGIISPWRMACSFNRSIWIPVTKYCYMYVTFVKTCLTFGEEKWRAIYARWSEKADMYFWFRWGKNKGKAIAL